MKILPQPRNERGQFPPVPQWQRDAMVAEYLSGSSSYKAAAKFGLSQGACMNALRQRGIARRPYGIHNRIHHFNQRFFENIDTEEKAYWLGFITADGCVTDRGAISINLSSVDRTHLESFRKSLGAEFPISTIPPAQRGFIKGGECSRLCLQSIAMRDDLIRLGVTPRKSLTVKPWEGCFGDLARHYWRGVIDGDGSIGFAKTSQWSVSLVGSELEVKAFEAWANSICGATAQSFKRKSIWSYRTSGKYIPGLLIKELYRDTTVALSRKQAIAEKIMALPQTDHWKPSITDEMLLREYEAGLSAYALSLKYGIADVTVARRIKRAGGSLRHGSEAQWIAAVRGARPSDDLLRIEYESGSSTYALAKKYQTNQTTVKRAVLRAGGKMRALREARLNALKNVTANEFGGVA